MVTMEHSSQQYSYKEYTFKRLSNVDGSIQLGKNDEDNCLKHYCLLSL